MIQVKSNILLKVKNIARIRIRDYNPIVFVLLMYTLCVILYPIFVGVAELIGIENVVYESMKETFADYSLTQMIVEVGLIGPIIETLILQSFVYYLLSKVPFFRRNWGIIVFIGGVLFAVWHAYSVYHTISMFPFGCILMFAYTIKKGKGGFWIASAIHIINNLVEIAKMVRDGYFY